MGRGIASPLKYFRLRTAPDCAPAGRLAFCLSVCVCVWAVGRALGAQRRGKLPETDRQWDSNDASVDDCLSAASAVGIPPRRYDRNPAFARAQRRPSLRSTDTTTALCVTADKCETNCARFSAADESPRHAALCGRRVVKTEDRTIQYPAVRDAILTCA